jgi:hypothetical protein
MTNNSAPEQLIDSNTLVELGWTRHYINKYLGAPDKVDEYTIGSYSYRKDVTRFFWLIEKVAKRGRSAKRHGLPLTAITHKDKLVRFATARKAVFVNEKCIGESNRAILAARTTMERILSQNANQPILQPSPNVLTESESAVA